MEHGKKNKNYINWEGKDWAGKVGGSGGLMPIRIPEGEKNNQRVGKEIEK